MRFIVVLFGHIQRRQSDMLMFDILRQISAVFMSASVFQRQKQSNLCQGPQLVNHA